MSKPKTMYSAKYVPHHMYAIDGSFVNVDTSLFIMVLPKIKKRARKANFSSLETSMLLEEYAAGNDLLQSSFTTEVTHKRNGGEWRISR